MISILFIMHMPPPVHGASMMGKYIHDSKLINESFCCHYINLTTATSLSDIGKVGFGKVKSFAKLLNKIQCEIERLKPNMVYVTPNSAGKAFYKDFLVVETVKRTLKKVKGSNGRVVLHFHNKGVKTRQSRWIDNILYRKFFKNVKVMLLAESLYGDIAKYVKRENVTFCGNGIPDVRQTRTVIKKEIPHLLFLSNMMRTKGVWELLDALAILKRRGLCFSCDFVGGWKDVQSEDFYLRLQEYGLEDCVCAHGAKYGMDKDVFFQNADVFVLPSYTEAFPLTVLEAMQHGLAVVASNVGGISGQIEDGITGKLIGGNTPVLTLDYMPNPQELSDALKSLLSDMNKCHAMGTAGYNKFKKEFTLQAFERNFVKSLQWAISR